MKKDYMLSLLGDGDNWSEIVSSEKNIFCNRPTRAAKIVLTKANDPTKEEHLSYYILFESPFASVSSVVSLVRGKWQLPSPHHPSDSNLTIYTIYEGKAKPPVSSLLSPSLWLNLSPHSFFSQTFYQLSSSDRRSVVYRELNADLDSRVGVSIVLPGCHHFKAHSIVMVT
jgi:hypothetical protein